MRIKKVCGDTGYNLLYRGNDLPLLIPYFAEDGLSDLLTNILYEQLNKFTLQQMKKYGVESNESLLFWTWDRKESC